MRPLLCDMDGVLVDSHVVAIRVWGRFAERHGVPLDALLSRMHGRRTRDVIAEAAPWLDADALAAPFDQEEADETDGFVPVRGAVELVRALPPDAWAVVTSADRVLATTRLAGAGIPLPHVVVTADDVEAGKPDPAPYLLAARRLGADPARCVVLEDAAAGIAAGLAAGATVIGVATSLAEADLLALGAHAAVPDLTAVPSALARLGAA